MPVETRYTLEEDDHLFMTFAAVAAKKSDCKKKVGACIVNEKKQIVGIGCNRKTEGDDLHAEDAAFTNASDIPDNCTLYVTRHPCLDCAKLIATNGIKKVFYIHWKPKYQDGATFLKKSNIDCTPYDPPHCINIDYSETEDESCKQSTSKSKKRKIE